MKYSKNIDLDGDSLLDCYNKIKFFSYDLTNKSSKGTLANLSKKLYPLNLALKPHFSSQNPRETNTLDSFPDFMDEYIKTTKKKKYKVPSTIAKYIKDPKKTQKGSFTTFEEPIKQNWMEKNTTMLSYDNYKDFKQQSLSVYKCNIKVPPKKYNLVSNKKNFSKRKKSTYKSINLRYLSVNFESKNSYKDPYNIKAELEKKIFTLEEIVKDPLVYGM
jgi:hypothetical protein